MGKMKELFMDNYEIDNTDDEFWSEQYQEELKELNSNLKKCPFVFVYGTLKEGFGNHTVLGESKLVGYARTKKQHKFANSYIPFAFIEEDDNGGIEGEVYKINDELTLRDIDYLEGHPNFYKREIIDVQFINEPEGSYHKVWMYFVQSFNPSRVVTTRKDERKNYSFESLNDEELPF